MIYIIITDCNVVPPSRNADVFEKSFYFSGQIKIIVFIIHK